MMDKLIVVRFPDEPETEIRGYSKKELANMYRVGKNYIPMMIDRFLAQFEAIGYQKTQKKLTGKQVGLLVSLIGSW